MTNTITMSGKMYATLKEELAEIAWYVCTYPAIKARADRIAKQIEDLERKAPDQNPNKD